MFKSSMFSAFAAPSCLMTAQTEGGEGAAPAVPQTRTEKLTAKAKALYDLVTAKTAEYNDVLAELQAIELVANVGAGDTVYGSVGIGAKKQLVSGVVLGVSEDEKGKLIKVQSGTGFDTTVFTLRSAQVTSVQPAVQAPTDEQIIEAGGVPDEVVEMPAQTPEFDAEQSA